jgi:hypothetical protein
MCSEGIREGSRRRVAHGLSVLLDRRSKNSRYLRGRRDLIEMIAHISATLRNDTSAREKLQSLPSQWWPAIGTFLMLAL